MSKFVLYLSNSNSLCTVINWLCIATELKYEQRIVNDISDMEHLVARNPNNLLPVLQDGELFLTEPQAIIKYLSVLASKNGSLGKWPELGVSDDIQFNAKLDELLSYSETLLKPAINEYINAYASNLQTGLNDRSKYTKVIGLLNTLNYRKKSTKFLLSDHLTIGDLIIYSNIYQICSGQFNWNKMAKLQGWFRVMDKIVQNVWTSESKCKECYESDSDDDDYILAETIMDHVKNDRSDLLDKLAKEGENINMPLAVVEAVNRGNLSILKVMRDHNCYLKWPMAVSVALRMSKGENVLALLFGPGQSPEDRKKEAEEILLNENRKMRVAMGLPPDPTKEELEKIENVKKLNKADVTINPMDPNTFNKVNDSEQKSESTDSEQKQESTLLT